MFTYPLNMDTPLNGETSEVEPGNWELMTVWDDQEPLTYPLIHLLNVTHPGPRCGGLPRACERDVPQVRGCHADAGRPEWNVSRTKGTKGWRVASGECRVVAQLPTMHSGQCRLRMLELLVYRQRQRGQ